MSTAEQGGATANATTSSYGGGGAGGKLRKKPFRRQTTPYDRPPTPLPINNTNTDSYGSRLTKMVVDSASKLISYGAGRFIPSVFRRSLPPPPPPPAQPHQPPEMEIAQESDGDQGEGLNSLGGDQEPRSGQCSQPRNSSSSNGVAELEHLLKQKTFTRSEIAHLTELLQSQAAEVSPGDASKNNVVSALDAGRQNEFASCLNRNDGIRSSAVMFTPIHNSNVLESDIASPAELAKAYMGSRPSQISPSALGMRNQFGKEGTGLLTNTLIASKSPIMSLAKKTSVSLSAVENGFTTPRPRGRSAIYNMARTPYSRVNPNSILKGSGINSSGYTGPSTSSSSLSPMENDENFVSRSVTLKRRNSVLDDEVGSVGPMRRIRQKPNLLTPRLHQTAYGVEMGSHVKPKSQLNSEERNKVLKNSGENDNESVPSTSYAHVPSKSREVAAKILQQLEKFSPREKSSESKIAAVQEKSPSKSIASRLPGQALQSMENVGSSKFLLSVPDYYNSGNKTNGTLLDVHGSPQKQGRSEVNNTHVCDIPSGRWDPVLNNDSAVSLKSSAPVIGASVVKNGESQPQKKRAFRMSANEDSLKQDDVECNGVPYGSLSENKGPLMSPHTKPAEEFKTTIQSEDKSFLGLASRSARENSPGASIAAPVSEGTIVSVSELGSNVLASSVLVFDKPKEANSPHVFGLSSTAADKSPLLSSESIRRVESEPERPTSLANISTSIGSEVRTPESDTGFHLKPVKAVDTNGKCDDVSYAALNGPLFSSCAPVSFPAASFSDVNRISTGSAPLFTSSTSITNFVPTGSSTSTAAPSGGSIFGLAVKSSSSVGPVSKPGFLADLSTSVSAAPTASFFSERADQKANIDINPSSGSSTSLYATGSGNGFFKIGSSLSNPTGNSLQGSLFASATKSPVSGVGTLSQGTTIVSVSSALVPAPNMNTSASLGSLPTPSISFGFSSTSSSADTISVVPAGGPTSSLLKFGATPTAGSEGSAVSSSTSATPSTFIFGFSSSSPSTNTVGSSSGPATPIFSASAINAASTFSSGTAGVFGFAGSSSASNTSNSLSSSSAPSNVFGSGWQSPKSPIFGSTSTSASPPTGFSFSASTNAEAPMAFNSSIGAPPPASAPIFSFTSASAPIFSFTSASASASALSTLPNTQPIFGNLPTGGGFGASPGNNDQMNAEDSMAEDPVPSSVSNSVFGQPSVSPSPPAFAFGSAVPSQNNPFMFNGQQQNQVPPQNPSPFQASSSLEFNAGGSFSLGSGGGGDKSGRKIVKVSRNKNRKK